MEERWIERRNDLHWSDEVEEIQECIELFAQENGQEYPFRKKYSEYQFARKCV